ncbi:MAG TPA: hypothetical protein DCL35_02460 [Candidatus Omnitrophica bacterium]|nr:hypothetical protein [Candidatus Omnitrophota bacterium]
MKDYVLELVKDSSGYNAKLNIMREYVQAYILRILQDKGFFHYAAFVGGTALRFIYGLPRFSEDLDFSMERKDKAYSFGDLLKAVESGLRSAGYSVSIISGSERAVHNAFVKFEGLLFEAGLSPLRSQKFSVKIEMDTHPPKGAEVKTVLINKYFPLSFLTYGNSSLFAGKIHAVLNRKYTKGRDYFDLGWYASRWGDMEPNLIMLNNALKQTGWEGDTVSSSSWRSIVTNTVERADWKKVRQDVESFLENPNDMDIFTKENVLSLFKPKGV